MTPEPSGFRQSVDSGLVLPARLSRERQVWTRDEWKLLERCTKMLSGPGGKGLRLQLACTHEACQGKPLEPKRLADGSFRLRCEHADRIIFIRDGVIVSDAKTHKKRIAKQYGDTQAHHKA